MGDFNSINVLWAVYKSIIQSVVKEVIVQSIGMRGLPECGELRNVSVLSSVITISSNLFTDCSKLVQIAVADSNPAHAIEDNILLDKDKTILITYPESKV